MPLMSESCLPRARLNPSLALQIAEAFLEKHEGYVLHAYQDSGGVWTIGVGHTGPDVHPGMTITPAECAGLLQVDALDAMGCVRDAVKVPLTAHQRAALTSFVFNVGQNAFLHGGPQGGPCTLLALLNQGKYDQVPKQLMRWVHDNGEVVQGLVNRRAAEVALWNSSKP